MLLKALILKELGFLCQKLERQNKLLSQSKKGSLIFKRLNKIHFCKNMPQNLNVLK